jgi:hypothetical protein
MAEPSVHGPIDFVLLEFPDNRLTGHAAEELLRLIDGGIIRVYDVLIIGKDRDGTVYSADLADEVDDRLGPFTKLGWARSGLLSEDDIAEAGGALEPGKLAVLIVYENTGAIPFVAAAMESGGELIAGARIPAQDVMDVLDALEQLELTTS